MGREAHWARPTRHVLTGVVLCPSRVSRAAGTARPGGAVACLAHAEHGPACNFFLKKTGCLCPLGFFLQIIFAENPQRL